MIASVSILVIVIFVICTPGTQQANRRSQQVVLDWLLERRELVSFRAILMHVLVQWDA